MGELIANAQHRKSREMGQSCCLDNATLILPSTRRKLLRQHGAEARLRRGRSALLALTLAWCHAGALKKTSAEAGDSAAHCTPATPWFCSRGDEFAQPAVTAAGRLDVARETAGGGGAGGLDANYRDAGGSGDIKETAAETEAAAGGDDGAWRQPHHKTHLCAQM